MPALCGSKKKLRRKKASGSRKGVKKKCRPGKVTRNAFFNFLRCYRTMNCGKSVVEIAVEGAKVWNKMPPEKKCKYIQEAFRAPKMRRRKPRSKKRRRSRSRGGPC